MNSFEFFPKENTIRLQDAFIYLILFGTFGAHQFYLGNKRRAFYLLFTCGISHLMVLFSARKLPFLHTSFDIKVSLIILCSGYFLGLPLWSWDLITLPMQVKKINRQTHLL